MGCGQVGSKSQYHVLVTCVSPLVCFLCEDKLLVSFPLCLTCMQAARLTLLGK